jgi:uncharacterized Zn finger protein
MSSKRTCFDPTVLLRCNRCNSETPHALIDFRKQPFSIALIYECQPCGEVRRLLDIDYSPESATARSENVVDEDKKERLSPLERGPQIDRNPR